MKKIIIVLVSLSLVGLIAFKLYANKTEMKENAKLSEISTESIPVQTVALESKIIETSRTADGLFEAKTDLSVISETQGKILNVYKEKGDKVTKGELLAQVENDLIKAEFNAAQANYEKFKLDRERFETLLKNNAVTERQYEDVNIGYINAETHYKQVKKRLENTSIRATTSGIINQDYVQEGGYISMGAKLYDIVDISSLKITVKLSANDIQKVHLGDEIPLSSSVFPGKEFKAKVKTIDVKSDASLKFGVELELDNSGKEQIRPGMYASAHFNFMSSEDHFLLNRNALIGSVQNPEVYVVSGETVKLRKIEVSNIYEDKVEVINGLSPKDRVVVSGQINLKDGIQVKVLK